MDSTGRIHELRAILLGADEAERKRAEALRKELEAKVGTLVTIPPDELESVKAMSLPRRRAWYDARAGKAARKRERAARKKGRRERSR